jgi:hypothetical protein
VKPKPDRSDRHGCCSQGGIRALDDYMTLLKLDGKWKIVNKVLSTQL